jgi:hypothetical protein
MIEIQKRITYADHFPNKQEAWLVFSACIVPLHIWITIVFLYNFPSLVLKANLWQILSVLSFTLVFTLLESLILFGFLVLVAAVMPRRLFRERFVYVGTRVALVIAGFALLVNTRFMQEATWAWVPILGVTGAGLFVLIRRPVDAAKQTALAERLTLMTALYLFLDLLALLFLLAGAILI